MTDSRRILQICPHDSAPFGDLVNVISTAGAAVDVQVTNVFLGPAANKPIQGCEYLDLEDLADTKVLARALTPACEEVWDLVLCHRHRAYWGAVRAGVVQERCVAIAHEFGMLKSWQRRLGRRWYGRGVHFAGVSKPVAEELAEVTGHSLVLPNAIDIQQLRQSRLGRSKALAELGLSDEGVTVGMVGRLHYKKRPALGLAAFNAFKADVPKARLVVMGDGPLAGELREQAGADVYFTGNVTNARNYMNAFDVLVYPAVADSFGMVVLEALDAGVPVITEATSGPAYVLEEMGFYAQGATPEEYAVALRRGLEKRGLKGDADIWRSRAQQRVEQLFSVSAMARMLDHLLIEGVSGAGWA
ncbi:MAG: glycosyltransferase family 4 protein [Pseudomonadota bacterium]